MVVWGDGKRSHIIIQDQKSAQELFDEADWRRVECGLCHDDEARDVTACA